VLVKKQSLRVSIVLSLLLGLTVTMVLAFLADFKSTVLALRSMQLAWLPLLLLLSLLHFLFRFLRWEYLLRTLGIRLRKGESLGIFLSGFLFTLTPGKIGEVLKAWLVRKLHGEPVAKVIPVVIAERYCDAGAMLLLASVGVLGSGRGGILWLLILVLLLLVYLAGSSPVLRRLLPRLPGRSAQVAESILDQSRALLRWKLLLPMLLYSAVAWFWQCWALALSVRALGSRLSLGEAVFNYSLSTLAGAVAFLPGGLGVTEGSLALMLIKRGGLVAADAAAATLLLRLATLWFAVLIGLIAFLWLARRWKGKSSLLRDIEESEGGQLFDLRKENED
jgi:uncharacterized protein (TIRG00374 family)